MCIDENTSSRTRRSDNTMASSKLHPSQDMKAIKRLRPRESSPPSVDGPSAKTSPFLTLSPFLTTGLWLMHVNLFDLTNFMSLHSCFFLSVSNMIFEASHPFMTPVSRP